MALMFALKIYLPPQAIVPLVIAAIALVVVAFAHDALAAWRRRNPRAARAFGIAVAVLGTAAAVYLAVLVVPTDEANDRIHDGKQLVSLLDILLAAVTGAIAAMMWRYAGSRQLGTLVGGAVAVALITKPWLFPLVEYRNGTAETIPPTTHIHLLFLICGLALAIVTSRVAFKRLQPAA